MIGVYKITNPKGAIYIGRSIDIDKRFYSYKNLRCKSQIRLYNSFIKYGVDNHIFEVIKECSINELNYYERHFQEYYNVLSDDYGLNLRYEPINGKSIISESTRIKLSIANKGEKNSMYGLTPWNKGKKGLQKAWNKGIKGVITQSDSFKLKASNRMIGNNYRIGIKHKEEDIKKISESSKGHNNPQSKKVINLETNEIFLCAKYAYNEYCKIRKISIYTFYDKLNGRIKNDTNYAYILKK